MQTSTPQSLLAEIDAAEHHSQSLRHADRVGRFLSMWGAIWVVGYLTEWRAPAWAGLVWIGLVAAGVLGGIVLARGWSRSGAGRSNGRRIGLAAAAFYAFAIATCTILHPDALQIAAFFPLVVGLGYVLLGLFWSTRIVVAGFAIFVLTLLGWFGLHDVFLPWMAACGAAMVAGGLAMRHA